MIEKLLQTEPARLIGLLAAVLGLVAGAGIVSQGRADAWVAFAGVLLPVLLPILQAWLTRRAVYAPATVQAIANEATNLPAGSTPDIGKPPDASPPLPEGGQG
jgi:hypothetical protein